MFRDVHKVSLRSQWTQIADLVLHSDLVYCSCSLFIGGCFNDTRSVRVTSFNLGGLINLFYSVCPLSAKALGSDFSFVITSGRITCCCGGHGNNSTRR